MPEKFMIEVSAREKRLLEQLREEELHGQAKAALTSEFDLNDIKPGMTQEQVAQAAAAIRRATAERERG